MSEISNKMKILVTFANTYDMPAEQGRDAMKGCTVNYFFLGGDGEQFKPMRSIDPAMAIGYQRSRVSLDYTMRGKIKEAPAVYDGEFIMTVGGDGKPTLKLVDLEFVQSLDVRQLLKAPEKAPSAGKETK